MQKTNSVINGVNLERLTGTYEAVQAKPSLGRFQFRLSNEWINCGHNQSVIQGFYGAGKEDESRNVSFIYANDEPDVLLGEDNAPNPAEFVLHALAGCLTTSLVYHAAAKGYEIRKVRSTLEGDLDLRGFLGIDGAERNGYKEIRVKFDLEGDFTDEQKEEIVNLGPAFSPVFDMLTHAVPVKISLSAAVPEAALDC